MWLFWPLLICLASTFYLIGLIWVIQLIQYPLFAKVGESNFADYHAEHSNRIVLALSLPVLLVFGSAFLLVWIHPTCVPDWATWLNLALTLSFWIVTALVQIPLHSKLGQGFSLQTIQTLVDSNWWRTAIWSGQGLLLIWMMTTALRDT